MVAVRFRVLGPVELLAADGRPLPLAGPRQRVLLAALLARVNQLLSADRLVDLVWSERLPEEPSAALHSQVARLRRSLRAAGDDGRDPLVTRAPGYLLEVDLSEVDSGRFEQLVAQARQAPPTEAARLLEEALALWRGPAYEGFEDVEVARIEAIRLEEARLAAVEQHTEALLAAGRAAEAVPLLEAFVAGHPLRERARATLLRAFVALGRQADALGGYQAYRTRIAEELGLEPSRGMQQLELEILRGEPPGGGRGGAAPTGLAALQVRYLRTAGGSRIAWGMVGSGPKLVTIPAWVTSLEVIASGRDPRSSLLERLAHELTLVCYDRAGTGLSQGEVRDFGLDPNVDELEAVVEAAGGPVALLAMSQAGPAALALAARRAELVRGLVLFGTYADGPSVFTDTELARLLVELIRTHWGLGSRLLADLYRPGASDEAARHFARVLRDSADREVAAAYLEAVFDVDVSALLPRVQAPAMVLHYRDDRLIPFRGGRQLAAGLPHATLLPLDGGWHLPDARDLDRIVAAVVDFVRSGGTG